MSLMDYWTVMVSVANFLNFCGLALYLAPETFLTEHYEETMIGVGTFLLYVSVMKYIQSSNEFYILPKTMITSSYHIFNALIAALPILIGISIFCMTFFSNSFRFRSFASSLIMLWSSMNGDELQNLWYFLEPLNLLASLFFCYVWVWIGNEFISPALLAIMEDGFI